MRRPTHLFVARLAGAAAASGLALAGLLVVASPAIAAACSGTTGVTVVVDTGSSISTTCASGDPSSAITALTAAGFSVTYPQQYPGSVVCRINGYPASDPCVRMPPGDAYWAFFHARRGGSWVYSASGAATYDPPPGSVIGFRFGSGQQPRIAPPSPTKTSAPVPTTTTSKPRSTTAAPRATAPSASSPTSAAGASSATARTRPTASASAAPSASPTAPGSASPSAGTTGSASPGPSQAASDLAAAPTSVDADGGTGPGTLIAGGALVALVAGGAGWAAWKRRD